MKSTLQLWVVALAICDFCNVNAYSVNGKKGISMSAEANINRRLFVSASIVSTVGMRLANAVAAPLPNVNTKAPDFLLPSSREDGSKTSLENLTSTKKWTVLYFYPGAFTQGCTLEARGFQRDYDTYRQKDVQVVGVSVDPPEKNAKFCESEKLDFYMLSDIGGDVSKKYGSALSVPGFGTFSNRQTYLIDPQGMIRHVFVDVESHVASHSKEVLDKLQELI